MAPPPPRPAGASQLLRAGPPARPATVLTALRFSRLAGSLSPSVTHANGSVGTRLPTFHARAADRTHVAYMPDTAWPVSGLPPDSSRADLLHPGFLMPSNWVTTRQQRSPKTGTAHRLPGPHLTHLVRLFHIAHHDGLQPTQHVVVCSLPPQGRLRRAKPSSPAQHHVQKLYLQTELPSMFVAHVDSHFTCHLVID